MSATLKLAGVRKDFDTGTSRVEVLRGVSFDVAAGQSLSIVGPSGSGKSTLLHLIGTLDRPSAGDITVDGSRPHELPERELARFRNETIGFVFQDHHLLPQFTVLENVLVPTLAFGRVAGDAEARARELLERVGLGHRLDHRPAELSGGERQRAAVARALIRRPRLLLCDEPTGSLDGKTADQVAALLFDLHEAEGNVLIIVTHSVKLAERCVRGLAIQDGLCSER